MRLCPQRVPADPSVDQVLACLVATRTNRGGLEEVGRKVEKEITSEAKISESSPALNSGLKALRDFQTTTATQLVVKVLGIIQSSNAGHLGAGSDLDMKKGWVVSSRFRWTGDEWEFG